MKHYKSIFFALPLVCLFFLRCDPIKKILGEDEKKSITFSNKDLVGSWLMEIDKGTSDYQNYTVTLNINSSGQLYNVQTGLTISMTLNGTPDGRMAWFDISRYPTSTATYTYEGYLNNEKNHALGTYLGVINYINGHQQSWSGTWELTRK